MCACVYVRVVVLVLVCARACACECVDVDPLCVSNQQHTHRSDGRAQARAPCGRHRERTLHRAPVHRAVIGHYHAAALHDRGQALRAHACVRAKQLRP